MLALNELLEQNDFEALRLYDPNSQLHNEISTKIRQIFEKLFQNTDINLDDFYFTGYDDNDPNAFFIEGTKTKNGKNIIAVSFGLIMALSNTEELAAIIGHESGHYLWSQLLGGRNTIFQERAADLRSVDLMMNAGYNPRNVVSAQTKIFKPFEYHSPTLDVHGSPIERIEDVKAHMTKISLERGYFPKVIPSDPEYDTFKQQLINIRKYEPYLSYIDSKIKLQFNTLDMKKINRADLIYYCIAYNLDNICENKTRLNQLNRIYSQFDFANNPPNEFEIKALRSIFNQLVYNMEEKNPDIERYLPSILSFSRLKDFDKFSELFHHINEMMSLASFSITDEIETLSPAYHAKKIIELAKYIPLSQHLANFKDIVVTFHPTPKIIGEIPFWVKLREKNNEDINTALNLVTQFPRLLSYNEKDYLYGEDGSVIAYGAEKDKLLKDKETEENKIEANKIFDAWAENQTDMLNQYNKINDFAKGKIDPKDMDYDFVMTVFSEWMLVPEMPELKVDKAKKINDKEFLEKQLDAIDKDKLLTLYNTIVSSAYYQDYKQYIASLETTENQNAVIVPEQLPPETDSKEIFNWLIKLSGQTMKQQVTMTNVYDAYIKMAQYYHDDGSIIYEDDIYKQLNDVAQTAKKNRYRHPVNMAIHDYIFENLPRHASKNIRFAPQMQEIMVKGVLKDISSNSTEIMDDIIRTLGFKRSPQTEEELIFVINKIKEYFKQAYPHDKEITDNIDLCDFDPINKNEAFLPIMPDSKFEYDNLLFPLLLSYLSSGYKCNPVTIIRLYDRYIYLSNYQESLAKLITNDLFNSLSLYDKIYLYEYFEDCYGFYGPAANKNYFIKQIVNEILTYPDYNTAISYAELILKRQNIAYNPLHMKYSDIEFANEREKLIEFYAEYWANKLGRDDNSPEFAERAQEFANFLTEKITTYKGTHTAFSTQIGGELSDRVANKIYAQEKVTKILDEVNTVKIKGEDAEKYDYFGRGAEGIITLLSKKPEYALATIDFINSELSDESIETLFQKTVKQISPEPDEDGQYRVFLSEIRESVVLNKEVVTLVHENFWAANLPIRAYLMNRLLNAYSTDEHKKLQLILDMFFTKDSEYYNDAQLVLQCIYDNLDDIERNLVLAALIASGKKSGTNEMTAGTAVGRGLKMFLQNKGPAFIKFGQLLSYLPNLDPDIRHELSTLRDKAKIPTRAELFNMLKTSLPESEYKKITHVGKILGAGSFFVTVQVKYQDKDCVISLMRPYTQELTRDGINTIAKTIQDMSDQDPKYAVLMNIVNQARDSAYSEIDIEQDHKKYADAVNIYESLTIHTPMGTYSPDVARWIAYGSSPNKNDAYKIMEMSPGVPLTSDELTEEERHDMAMAYTALELSILLSGNKWDTDRHAGQQNFSNPAFREFCIGIFDTGAQMNKSPRRIDKRMLGYLLYFLIKGISAGKTMSELLTTKVQDIDRVCKKYGINTAYIDSVQRGLTALSDIIQYQKEIRDDNGNIIQEAKSLTAEDLENIALAILESGIIDRTLINTTKAHFVLDMLAFWKQQEQMQPLSVEKQDNPIRITVGPAIKMQIQTHVINKAIEELEQMREEERQQEHLGVKIGITERKPNTPQTPNDYGAIRT